MAQEKYLMGKVQLVLLQKVLTVTKTGKHTPKHNLTYLIKSGKLVSAVSFIPGILLVKLGAIRAICITEKIFRDTFL